LSGVRQPGVVAEGQGSREGTRSHCGQEGCNRAVRMGKRIGVGVLADSRISAKTSVTGSAYLHGSDLVEGPMFHSEGYDVLIQHLIKRRL
jgi:hypothetical protein